MAAQNALFRRPGRRWGQQQPNRARSDHEPSKRVPDNPATAPAAGTLRHAGPRSDGESCMTRETPLVHFYENSLSAIQYIADSIHRNGKAGSKQSLFPKNNEMRQ